MIGQVRDNVRGRDLSPIGGEVHNLSPNPRPTSHTIGRGMSKSPQRIQQNPITHEPLTHQKAQAGYLEEKACSILMLDRVGVLEKEILAFGLERKKILTEMDKIDNMKVKTKEIIYRRRQIDS